MNSTFNLSDYNARIEDYIGVTVFWTINKFNMETEQVQSLLEGCGLDSSLIHSVSPKVALKRASRDFSRSQNTKEEVCFSRSIVDDKKSTIIGVVAEEADKEHSRLNYHQTITASLDKSSGVVKISGRGKKALLEKLNNFQKNTTDEDIRRLVYLFVDKLSGCALRASGGIYFVPKIKVPTLVKLENFISKLNCGKLYLMRMTNADVEKRIAWEAAEEEIKQKVAKIEFAVSNITGRMSFVTRQSEKLEEIKKMTDYYIELCDAQVASEAIRETLNAAEKQIADKIVEIQNM